MRVAFAQMCSSSSPEKNLSEVERQYERAIQQKASLLVLPENFLAMGARFKSLVDTDWQKYIDVISDLSRVHELACIAGTIPVLDPDNSPKRFARSIFFDERGEIKQRYDKIHLFDVDVGDEKGVYKESNYYSAGRMPVMVEHDGVSIGLTVCFDLRFPSLFQHYRLAGTQLIVVPSAFTELTGKKHWEVLLRARAIESQAFILAPNQVGLHDDGRRTWGHSMLVSPDGEVLVDLGDEPGFGCADLDLSMVDAIRRSMPLNARL